MKQHKLFQRVMAAILFSSLLVGCSTFLPRDTSILTPVDFTETLKTTFTPTVSSTPLPSVTPSPRPTKTATPMPAWVTDFAEPIMAAIADRPPDFEEDFSQAGPNWYLETVSCPDNGCSLSEGVLSVTAFPVENKEAWAEQPLGPCCSRFKTFVMQVDVDPSKLTDENSASIWYTANMYEGNKFTTIFHLTFELKNDRRWSSWIGPSGFGGDSGQLPRSTPMPIIFTLISRDSMLAVYLNDIPVTFVEYAGGQYQPGFELCAWSAGRTAAHAEFDNVKVWNLDNIPILP
jgi:hypothetical protein